MAALRSPANVEISGWASRSLPLTRMMQSTALDSITDSPAAKPKRSRRTKVLLTIIAALAAYAAYDLWGPRTSSLRAFDPDEVARLETAMWRSYYSRQQVKLYNQLTELLRSQYNVPFVRSNAIAYQASRAAFVFKDGHNREEYEKALPYLVRFYSEIRKVSDRAFDTQRAARLELEWWIIHRERHKHEPGDLGRALAELSAEIYGVPIDRVMNHAQLRAEAMTIRDTEAESGRVTEEDWKRIDDLLHASWRSLKDAVQE